MLKTLAIEYGNLAKGKNTPQKQAAFTCARLSSWLKLVMRLKVMRVDDHNCPTTTNKQ